MRREEDALRRNIDRNVHDPLAEVIQGQISELVTALNRERDAWRTLHNAKSQGPYSYADQRQRDEITAAKFILGVK